MSFTIEIAWVITVLLVGLRLGAVLVFSPLFTVPQLPGNIRVLLVLALSTVMVSGLSIGLAPSLSVYELAAASIGELIVGGMLGFGLLAAFAVFQFAGRIADVQLGFGVATLIDPGSRTQAPLLGTILNLVALMVFFAIDGHHLLLRGIVFSLQQIPPGSGLGELSAATLILQFGQMFLFAVMLIAPVMFVIFIVDVIIALIARTMPQVNVFIVSLPLKIFIGLLVLVMSLHYITPVFKRVFESLFGHWHDMLAYTGVVGYG